MKQIVIDSGLNVDLLLIKKDYNLFKEIDFVLLKIIKTSSWFLFFSLGQKTTIRGQIIMLMGWQSNKRWLLLQVWFSDKYFCHTVKSPGAKSVRKNRKAKAYSWIRSNETIMKISYIWSTRAPRNLMRISWQWKRYSFLELFSLVEAESKNKFCYYSVCRLMGSWIMGSIG